jgi:hypothetical protein
MGLPDGLGGSGCVVGGSAGSRDAAGGGCGEAVHSCGRGVVVGDGPSAGGGAQTGVPTRGDSDGDGFGLGSAFDDPPGTDGPGLPGCPGTLAGSSPL